MKNYFLILFFVFAYHSVYAQGTTGWMDQKRTQHKYLIQQLLGLKLYSRFLQLGYQNSKNKLSLIGESKNKEYALHRNYFNSLKTVSPLVTKYKKVAQIIGLVDKMMKEQHHSIQWIKKQEFFSLPEVSQVKEVFSRVTADASQVLEDLFEILQDDHLEMTDSERMSRIDLLYEEAQEQYQFCKSFGNDSRMLALLRWKEKNEVRISRAIGGIKN